MTTTTLPRAALRNVVLFSAAFADSKMRVEPRTGPNGQYNVLVVEDLPVFRSGTFRDSMGFQHTWEPLHMDQIVANYSLMKNRGYLVDVPVRKDHSGFLSNRMDETIGYHTDLRTELRTNPVDGTEQTYVIATLEVADPSAIEKISSGLWRNVSAEVGSFTANNETEFWPAYQGVAYVDIPAVEGLKSFNNHNGIGTEFSIMLDPNEQQEDAVTAPILPNPTPAAPPATPTDTAYHGRANFTFSINGTATQDFAKVQAHITAIEAQNATFSAAAAEAKMTNRKLYIKGLAEGATPKILASQIPAIEGYALNLDDAGWENFTKAHDGMPALSSVSQHANATQNGGQPMNPAGTTPVAPPAGSPSEYDTAAAVVQQHFRSGMTPDKIKQTASYAKLVAGQKTQADYPILAKIA